MRRGLAGRLGRLALAAKPGRCRWAGGRCVQHAVVGDGSDDPPDPELPDACADCGRPILWRLVRVLGVDVSKLQGRAGLGFPPAARAYAAHLAAAQGLDARGVLTGARAVLGQTAAAGATTTPALAEQATRQDVQVPAAAGLVAGRAGARRGRRRGVAGLAQPGHRPGPDGAGGACVTSDRRTGPTTGELQRQTRLNDGLQGPCRSARKRHGSPVFDAYNAPLEPVR